MATPLKWRPSSVLSFEVNAITHHTPAGLAEGFYFAYVEDASLGQFDESPHGLAAAMGECQKHADKYGVRANDQAGQAAA